LLHGAWFPQAALLQLANIGREERFIDLKCPGKPLSRRGTPGDVKMLFS
jgi:hypothetical protein